MELQTLNSHFEPIAVFENYSSLIFTERYSAAGDFELVTTDVARCMRALPRESFITVKDSLTPMVVENYKLEKPKNEAPVLTVTGRSFETVLERRGSTKDPFPKTSAQAAWTITAEKESDAAFQAMRAVLGDGEQVRGSVALGAVGPGASPLDAIPEIQLVLPADYTTATPNKYVVPIENSLYKTVYDFIQTNRRGIKASRPITGSNHPGKVALEIYNGADQTAIISFDARFDQFDSSTYLFSEQGSTNVAYVFGSNGTQIVLKTAGPEPSGLARRVLPINIASDSASNSADSRKSRGLVELYKNNVTALFTGEIAQQVAEGYNHSYFMGDILKLVGEYGLTANVRVAEFIRSSDSSGEKAFPTFEIIAVE